MLPAQRLLPSDYSPWIAAKLRAISCVHGQGARAFSNIYVRGRADGGAFTKVRPQKRLFVTSSLGVSIGAPPSSEPRDAASGPALLGETRCAWRARGDDDFSLTDAAVRTSYPDCCRPRGKIEGRRRETRSGQGG